MRQTDPGARAAATYLQRLLILLIPVTIALMGWYELGMEHRLAVVPDAAEHDAVEDDRSTGGASMGRLRYDGTSRILECEIRERFEWPFCQVSFALATPPDGIDLRRYDTLSLELDADGPSNPPKVRVYLRNFDPEYARTGDPVSLRVNAIEYRPANKDGRLDVPLEHFTVAPWWLEENDIPFAESRVRIDNVPIIEVLTASNAEEGLHRIRIDRLELTGKWFERDALYLGILALWMSAALALLSTQLLAARHRARAARARQVELEAINDALELQTAALSQQAHHDPLTGVRNRAGIRDILHQAVQQARAGEGPLSLILLDIDRFKSINDTHGHTVGDEVLCALTCRIGENTRGNDHLARWGGEEFLLVCTDTQLDDALQLAEKLRAVIAGSEWPHGDAMTCSMGVGALGDESMTALLERVDRALYAAKSAGRNRVMAGEPPPFRG